MACGDFNHWSRGLSPGYWFTGTNTGTSSGSLTARGLTDYTSSSSAKVINGKLYFVTTELTPSGDKVTYMSRPDRIRSIGEPEPEVAARPDRSWLASAGWLVFGAGWAAACWWLAVSV